MRELSSKTLFFETQHFSFPREDEASPRQSILDKFCQSEVKTFRHCMTANNYDENKCLESKGFVDRCASLAFKKVNSEPEWIFWEALSLKGLRPLTVPSVLIP